MPAVTPWFTGTPVPLAYLSTDSTGTPRDAALLASVTCVVTLPDGSTATPPVTHSGAGGSGMYVAVYTSTQPGHHTFTFTNADPAYPGAFGDSFEVQPLPDTTIVSLDEAKEILHQTATTAYDAKIQGWNAAVTNVIEYWCGPVIQQTVTERLPARGVTLQLSKPPVLSLVAWTGYPPGLAGSGIVIPSPPSPMFPTMFYGVAYPLTQLYADPSTGLVTHTSGLPFFYGTYIWQYTAGRPVIPACIYEASKIILKHLYMVEGGGTGTGTGTGDEEDTMPTPFGFAIPNRAYELLTPELAASRMVAA